MNLSEDQKVSFEKDGFLVIKDFWTQSTVGDLRGRIGSIVDNADLSEVRSVFSTKDQIRKSDDYFLTSAREIRFFWEEKAWDSEKEKLTKPANEAINKVGHGLHDLDPLFEAVSYEDRVGCICRQLGMQKPLVAQSMYIFKQAKIGGECTPHQDGAFLYTEPQSCIGFWWPLDDCTQANGCLWAVPGSHNLGVHRRFRRRDAPQEGTEFSPLNPPSDWDLSGAVPLETSAGSLVVLHSAVVHYSEENKSSTSRHAYSIHVVDGKEGIVYPKDNWLQRPVDQPFREIANGGGGVEVKASV